MTRIVIIGLVIILAAGVAFAEVIKMDKKVGDYSVNIMMDNPPSVGSNIMEILITNNEGNPVKNTKVQVDYGTSDIAYKATLLKHGSWYHTALNISKEGPWYVNITITSQRKTVFTKFTFDVI